MEFHSLKDVLQEQLEDLHSAETQLIAALPKMAQAAHHDQLREAFETHLEETKGHVARLEQVFASLDEKVTGKHCDGIAGIIEEGKSAMEESFDDATMDACLIGSGRRAEHYEMAAYSTMIGWARAMGHSDAVTLLEEILDEERAADEKLSGLAEDGINEEAAAGANAIATANDEAPRRGPAKGNSKKAKRSGR